MNGRKKKPGREVAMTVLLVLATFVAFLLLDYFYSRKHAPVLAPELKAEALPRLRPEFVAGFQLPENLRYHPGHAWALAESPNLVRIGMDDFAAHLVGPTAHIQLPQRGRWVRQGQKVWSVQRDGSTVDMFSPVEGIVTDVNDEAARHPERALSDPYGQGWLVKIQSPEAQTSFRNLLGGDLARKWMEEAAARLFGKMPALAGAVAQDGGAAVTDLAVELPVADWAELTREFFLS